MNADQTRTGLDPRVPPLVALPQLGAVLVVAGDPLAAQIAFILAVVGNVPVALAGRLATTAVLERSVAEGIIEWARPVAAWAYALLLTALLPYVDASVATPLLTAAGANAIAGALMYVAPGASSPAGARLRDRRRAGVARRHEAIVFTASRCARLAVPAAAVLVLAGRPIAGLLSLWAAVGCGAGASPCCSTTRTTAR